MTGYINGSSDAGYADGGLFVAAYNSSWVSQIFSNFRTGEISVRGKNNGTWKDWRFVHDSGHFSTTDVANGVTAMVGVTTQMKDIQLQILIPN